MYIVKMVTIQKKNAQGNPYAGIESSWNLKHWWQFGMWRERTEGVIGTGTE